MRARQEIPWSFLSKTYDGQALLTE
jgi:hypothetical protein